MFGFDGATAMEPMEETFSSSVTGFQAVPPSEDFQTPPAAVAA